jgi:Flp pilus assembly protein TadG
MPRLRRLISRLVVVHARHGTTIEPAPEGLQMRNFARVARVLGSFCADTSGIMLPYATAVFVVFIGFATLAIDGSRYMSLQTQMQAAADALALAGARELDQRSGAQSRAISAMANTTFGNDNTLFGMGTAPTLTYAYAFYKSLPAANAGFSGTTTTSDADTKFVAVTVTAVTVETIFPVKYFQAHGSNSFSAGAQAIAGFTNQTVCDIAPVFICNPYETAGMTDSQATQALRTNFADAAVLRKQYRLDATMTSPGHFGYLMPPDRCNGASCLEQWIATVSPRGCYQKSGVDLNTGQKTSVANGFNVRFDIYPGGNKLGPSATYAPSVNVRRGFLPNNKQSWCSPNPASPYYTTLPAYAKPVLNTTGTTTSTGKQSARSDITNVPSADIVNVFAGQMITGTNIPANTTVVSVSTSKQTITMSNAATGSGSGIALTIKWETSGLPLDSNLVNTTTMFGNGNWDCANYWALNHTAAAPSGCTSSNPTVSRYQVYRYEIANALVGDWSGNGLANTSGHTGNGESGAPLCAAASSVSGVDTSTGGKDRRVILVAIINCLAQSGLITGGQTANNVPVAEFGKYFITQPVNADGTNSYLYGEMTGLVGPSDARIYNQVQLYR